MGTDLTPSRVAVHGRPTAVLLILAAGLAAWMLRVGHVFEPAARPATTATRPVEPTFGATVPR